MFIGPRITKVFASRWHAALWAGGVLLSAYMFAQHGGPSAADVAQVASIAAPGEAASTAAPTNPWAPGAASTPNTPPPSAAVVEQPASAAPADVPPDPAPPSQPNYSTSGLPVAN